MEVLLSEELNKSNPHLETQDSIDSDSKGRCKMKWRERNKMNINGIASTSLTVWAITLLPSGLEIGISLHSGPQRRDEITLDEQEIKWGKNYRD